MGSKCLTEFIDPHWDMLLDYIVQGKVVPVIGPELLVAGEDNANGSFYGVVLQHLSEYIRVSAQEGETFDDFFLRCQYEKRILVSRIRPALAEILGRLAEMKQPLLDKLSAIRSFKLILTTTPDDLMFHSLKKVDGVEPELCFFSRHFSEKSDIPNSFFNDQSRCVYHLYGRAMRGLDYAVSEDERLDYSCSWMDSGVRPQNLIKYLSDKYLLILGCGYENWLARFFLYGLKGKGLFENEKGSGLLADSYTPTDLHIGSFLDRCHGNIYYDGDAGAFVEELSKRVSNISMPMLKKGEPVFVKGDVFISYASEDRPAALKIKEQLESAGLSVWLDTYKLQSGDAYAEKIRTNIKNSSFFLPVLSKRVTVREPRFFRKEWYWAGEESTCRIQTLPFIHPIAIDEIEANDSSINTCIRDRHWTRANAGVLSDEFIRKFSALCEQMKGVLK